MISERISGTMISEQRWIEQSSIDHKIYSFPNNQPKVLELSFFLCTFAAIYRQIEDEEIFRTDLCRHSGLLGYGWRDYRQVRR